ncbi:hypothetical protein IU476_09260 [Nocardia blacklockiae]|nr:hypothetical protein [Nocardia blacklockiae]
MGVAVVAGCSVVREASRSETARAQVGDCLDVRAASTTDSDTEPVECGTKRAVYRVMSTSPTKVDCGAEYSSYEETFQGGTTVFLCLAPDLVQGSCYHRDRDTGFAYADCEAPEATVRVVARVDGRTDAALCAADATFLLLSAPATTFCMVNPKL